MELGGYLGRSPGNGSSKGSGRTGALQIILDSSGIALILLTEKGDALPHLEVNHTLDLAYY